MSLPPSATITVVYDHDLEAAADALLAVLRGRPAPASKADAEEHAEPEEAAA